MNYKKMTQKELSELYMKCETAIKHTQKKKKEYIEKNLQSFDENINRYIHIQDKIKELITTKETDVTSLETLINDL